jgi:hypothetical protein
MLLVYKQPCTRRSLRHTRPERLSKSLTAAAKAARPPRTAVHPPLPSHLLLLRLVRLTDERDRSHVQKIKDRRCSQCLYHSRSLNGINRAKYEGMRGAVLVKVSEDSIENYMCLTAGSMLWSLGRTFTEINRSHV